MSKTKKGTEFELAVERILKSMYSKYEQVTITHNVKINGPDTERQIDVLIEVVMEDLKLRVAVECKDYKGKLAIGKIDEFVSKLADVSASKGIMIARNGFSTAAIKKAKRNNILLYSLNDKLEDDSLDFPILVEEINPNTVRFGATIHPRPGGQRLDLRNPIIINGIDVTEAFISAWKDSKIDYQLTTDWQRVIIPGIEPPYLIKQEYKELGYTDEFRNEDFFFEVKLQISYYYLKLSTVVGLDVFKNINEGKASIYFETKSIRDSFPHAQLIPKSLADTFNGVRITALVYEGLKYTFDGPFFKR